jgi:hypothetical protein
MDFMDLILRLNSVPRVYGSFETSDSTSHSHSIFRLECEFSSEFTETEPQNDVVNWHI